MMTAEIKPIPESPYRGIEPFRFIDQQIFAARDDETWALLSNIMIYRGVLLYGDSGTGKSSLINAGLIPKALKENLIPNLLRVQPRRRKEIKLERIPIEADGRPPYLPSTFTEENEASTLEFSIGEIYRRLRRLKSSGIGEARPLLIFDQFEEFVTLFEEASRGGVTEKARVAQKEAPEAHRLILKALTRLIYDDRLPIKILFVFREDYLAKLNILFENCPNLLDQYSRLVMPRAEVLQQIIRAPFENKELRDEFSRRQPGQKGAELTKLADKIAAELTNRGDSAVNLSELQIVCRKLWESTNPTLLFKEKSIQELIEEYWAEALNKFPGELQAPAIALLGHMITSSNTRNIVSEDDLLARERENFDEQQLRGALEALIGSRLVRREPRYKVYFYEIVSEYLVPWIQRLKAARLAELERLKAHHKLELAQKEKSTLQKWRIGLVALSVLLVVAAIYFLSLRANAQKAETEAKSARRVAEDALGKVERERDRNGKIIDMLKHLTSPNAEDRLSAIQEIDALANKEGIPLELGNALLTTVLTDKDPRVKEKASELLAQAAQSSPELTQTISTTAKNDKGLAIRLPTRAYIQIEGRDNEGQIARADKIKSVLTAKGIIVPGYEYGKKAPSKNQLRYCQITEGALQPNDIARLISKADGQTWTPIEITECKNSNKVRPNHYELWLASTSEGKVEAVFKVTDEDGTQELSGEYWLYVEPGADGVPQTILNQKPFTVHLSPGTYKVDVRKEGKWVYGQQFRIVAAKARVEIKVRIPFERD